MEKHIGPAFATATGQRFTGEAGGSTELAQLIRAGLRRPDVFISADPAVDRQLLMGPSNRHLVTRYAVFAADELVIAFSPHSRFARQLRAAAAGRTPWYQVLETPGIQFGRTDPRLDPKGVRALLMLELAARYYHKPDLLRAVAGSPDNPAQIYPEETLLARLSGGQMDAAVAYRHEAVAWGLPYIPLPAAVNLGDPRFANVYRTAAATVAGRTYRGAPIQFTVAIPAEAVNRAGAQQFVNFLLGSRGRAFLAEGGFRVKRPRWVGGG